MKRSIAILTVIALLLSFPAGVTAAESADEVKYSYETKSFSETDRTYKNQGLIARLTLNNYLGSVDAKLTTRFGAADSKVMVIYIPTDKWDGDCAYGALSGRLTTTGISVYEGSDLVIGWKDMYTYGFLDVEGGMYTFDDDTVEMHFTKGPGLYTGVAALPVVKGETAGKTYEEALKQAALDKKELDYLPVGYNFILALNDEMIDYFLEHGKLEKVSTYNWPGLRELLLEARYEVELPKAEAGLANFKVKKPYIRGQFLDMPYTSTRWFDSYVAAASSYGLMGGYSNGTFRPGDSISLAECLVIAANMRDIYYGGQGQFSSGGNPWYNVYVNYAIKYGIIKRGDFAKYDEKASRAEVCYILYNALPKDAFRKTQLSPLFSDVNAATPYSASIYGMYETGMVGGYKDGTFRPENEITRAEICVILANMLKK